MFELCKKEDVSELISITKSNSGFSGPLLAETHIKLGRLLAKYLPVDPKDTTVIAILRGGIFFDQGIYFELNCQFELFNPKNHPFVRPKTQNIIFVDSVINTGNTIKPFLGKNDFVACNVINENAVSLFSKQLFTVRISSNYFIGSSIKNQEGTRGPDTTMRLFNQI